MSAIIVFKPLRRGVIPPKKATPRAVGYDLRAAIEQIRYIAPWEVITVPCGFVLAIPNGFEGQIRSRSGLAREGIMVANGVGTIDPDYRGEVKVLLYNSTRIAYPLHPWDRIAQLVVAPVMVADFIEQDPGMTKRGTGGFGSTGKV